MNKFEKKEYVYINPGTEEVKNATVEDACINIGHFLMDLNLKGLTAERRPENDYGGGRYAFIICNKNRGNKTVEIQMPGIALDRVRYTDPETQNIWDFPRLYVDDSSWVWCFALNCAKYSLTTVEDADTKGGEEN